MSPVRRDAKTGRYQLRPDAQPYVPPKTIVPEDPDEARGGHGLYLDSCKDMEACK